MKLISFCRNLHSVVVSEMRIRRFDAREAKHSKNNRERDQRKQREFAARFSRSLSGFSGLQRLRRMENKHRGLSRSQLLFWPFCRRLLLPSQAAGFVFLRLALSALSAQLDKTLQIHYSVEHPEEQAQLYRPHRALCCFLFILYEIFFHFHFVFNPPREETRLLSYSYVAGDRVKTLGVEAARNISSRFPHPKRVWKSDWKFL